MLHSNCLHQVKDSSHSTKLCQILYIAKQDRYSLSPSVGSCMRSPFPSFFIKHSTLMKTLSQEKCECPRSIAVALEIKHYVTYDFNRLDYHIIFTCLPLVIVPA